MDFFNAIILGLIEGVTEFLPISSTGHLILANRAMGIAETEFTKSFTIAIQAGAILSVVVLYGRSLLVDIKVLKRVGVAFLPTAVLGLTFYNFIKTYLLGSAMVVVSSLFFGGVLLIVFELLHKEREGLSEDLREIPLQTAFFIGLFQSIAMVPGVSRSAATILGGLILGLKRKAIVEFSFLLAVPTMLAATALDLSQSAPSFSLEEFAALAVGFAVSFFVALLSIKFLLRYIKTHNFIPFGIYRIIVALLFLILGVPVSL